MGGQKARAARRARRREELRQQRWQAAVSAATALACEGGRAAVTTRALVARVGFSQPVLYESIGSMADLWEEVTRRAVQVLGDELEVLDGLPTPEAFLLHLVWFARERPGLHDAIWVDGVAPPWLTDWLVESREAVGGPPASTSGGVRAQAVIALATVQGLVLRERSGPGSPEESRAAVAELVALLGWTDPQAARQ
ncbi:MULTISPECIES: TetR family transcriptional regulator [Kytococcus]|uniref:TetR family transcriptional regulator n=1 Tax=Kytococcus TaxID=57499 RepID=UPI00143913A1|nr:MULTISPECIES: TetR family transcriptional regulator [Kytococcus]